MTNKQLQTYRQALEEMVKRVGRTAASVEAGVRVPTGGQGSGLESNAPFHLADVGSEVYFQELNATLLENEAFLHDEAQTALERIDNGTYGQCENCHQTIPDERLEALPYTRYCVKCASKLGSGVAVNLDEGRPKAWGNGDETRGGNAETEPIARAGDRAPFSRVEDLSDAGRDRADVHAAGTPGGGTAIGGLAGTTIGDGDPAMAGLEHAMGSGRFDVDIEDDDSPVTAYSGLSGGAVGGTPAGKRAKGGKKRPPKG